MRFGDSGHRHLEMRKQQFLGELKYLWLAGLACKLGLAASTSVCLDALEWEAVDTCEVSKE